VNNTNNIQMNIKLSNVIFILSVIGGIIYYIIVSPETEYIRIGFRMLINGDCSSLSQRLLGLIYLTLYRFRRFSII
jgi:hypothetical protein